MFYVSVITIGDTKLEANVCCFKNQCKIKACNYFFISFAIMRYSQLNLDTY